MFCVLFPNLIVFPLVVSPVTLLEMLVEVIVVAEVFLGGEVVVVFLFVSVFFLVIQIVESLGKKSINIIVIGTFLSYNLEGNSVYCSW